MKVHYKNKRLERVTIGINSLAAAIVTATFVLLFGFDRPLVSTTVLHIAQYVILFVFVAEKIVRAFNTVSVKEYLRSFWFQIPLLVGLLVILIGAGRFFWMENPAAIRNTAVGIYLALQVVIKLCRTSVNLAASGKNPTLTLIASFLVLIIAGAGLLVLPRSAAKENLSFVDALFTATSATCVTGLIVRDTGEDFSLMGQCVILALIQLGGLGIVVFGAVFALLLGQALSVRESVAMQDILSARTLSRIGHMIAFIFFGTFFIEAVGTLSLLGIWREGEGALITGGYQWFYSIFHSISAFCNAGFCLFSNSLIGYSENWQAYLVICPLIILGGLGFSVLYDLSNISVDRIKRSFKKLFSKKHRFSMEAPRRIRLQSKIVLAVSGCLIIGGALLIMLFEHYVGAGSSKSGGFFGALFQSITARTAGFNTIDITAMSAPGKFVLILLMFIGGSPGSTAGGIKTVTLAVIIMTVFAALRKRQEVEMFKRSIRIVIVGRAITVVMLFVVVLFVAALLLTITESDNGFSMGDIWFEAASALGTVGLSTGITGSLTTVGKLIIIAVMLIGRLGPLTLLAALTFNLKPLKYNYPDEAVIVG